MVKRKKTVGLTAFLKGTSNPEDGMPGCANYDHHHGGCLSCWRGCEDGNCLSCIDFGPYTYCRVERGKRCGYFERAVLPTAGDIRLRQWVYSLYEKQVGLAGSGGLGREPVRGCPDCGAELKPRQRYCDQCSRRRRVGSHRKKRQKKRGYAPQLIKIAPEILHPKGCLEAV